MALAKEEIFIMKNEDPVYYSIEETAKKLKISEPYLYKLMRKGEIKSFKIGRRTFFTPEAIKDFIRNKN